MKKISVLITVALLAFSMLISCDGGMSGAKDKIPEKFRNIEATGWDGKTVRFNDYGIPSEIAGNSKEMEANLPKQGDWWDYEIKFSFDDADRYYLKTSYSDSTLIMEYRKNFENPEYYAAQTESPEAPEWIKSKFYRTDRMEISFDREGKVNLEPNSINRQIISASTENSVSYIIGNKTQEPSILMITKMENRTLKAEWKSVFEKGEGEIYTLEADPDQQGPEWIRNLSLFALYEQDSIYDFDAEGQYKDPDPSWRWKIEEKADGSSPLVKYYGVKLDGDNRKLESVTVIIYKTNDHAFKAEIINPTKFDPATGDAESYGNDRKVNLYKADDSHEFLKNTEWVDADGTILKFDANGLWTAGAAEGEYRTGIKEEYTNYSVQYISFSTYVFNGTGYTRHSLRLAYDMDNPENGIQKLDNTASWGSGTVFTKKVTE